MAPDSEPPSDPVVVALVELVRLFMGLDEDQVTIYNNDWNIPPDKRIYVSVALLASRQFGSSNSTRSEAGVPAPIGGLPTPGKLIEVITVQEQETYTLNIFGATNSPMLRRWELDAVLNSAMGQQAQENGGFRLSRNSISVVDLSGLEGSARLFRYAVTIVLLRSRTRENVIEYFDDFRGSPVLNIEP